MSAQCFQSVGPFFVLISICPPDHHSPSAWGREEHRGGSNVRDGGIGDSILSVAAADEGLFTSCSATRTTRMMSKQQPYIMNLGDFSYARRLRLMKNWELLVQFISFLDGSCYFVQHSIQFI
ncbi:hypothetical protein PVAP13_3KG566801 [Panicum virgatum]|uniref:Uncharacterized protein n=1 Tax=Panicum virgatum TaxID=38727 RepID=A0A8T0VFF6_PANVG|nr:hypothetical protein PVAP13_3KG566801 [Panicum virgatum]